MAGACYGNPDCKIQNVKVECGETAARKRRDRNEENQNFKIPLTVSFTLQVPLPNTTNESFDLNRTSLQLSNDIMSALKKEDMTLNVSGTVLVKDRSRPPVLRFMRLICNEGQVQSGGTCGKKHL